MRRASSIAALLAGTVIAGSVGVAEASSGTVAVPNEHCVRLDVADNAMSVRGLHYANKGGGLFGIIVRADWVVSAQSPRAGTKVKRGSTVKLYAARSC